MLTLVVAIYAAFVTVLAVTLYNRSRVEGSYTSVGWFHSAGTIGVVRTWPMCEDCEMVYRQTGVKERVGR